jgi:hypothetical protein
MKARTLTQSEGARVRRLHCHACHWFGFGVVCTEQQKDEPTDRARAGGGLRGNEPPRAPLQHSHLASKRIQYVIVLGESKTRGIGSECLACFTRRGVTRPQAGPCR